MRKKLKCSTARELVRVKATIPDSVMKSSMRKLKEAVPMFNSIVLSPSKFQGVDCKGKGVMNHKDAKEAQPARWPATKPAKETGRKVEWGLGGSGRRVAKTRSLSD